MCSEGKNRRILEGKKPNPNHITPNKPNQTRNQTKQSKANQPNKTPKKENQSQTKQQRGRRMPVVTNTPLGLHLEDTKLKTELKYDREESSNVCSTHPVGTCSFCVGARKGAELCVTADLTLGGTGTALELTCSEAHIPSDSLERAEEDAGTRH